MTATERRAFQLVKTLGANLGQLDILVEDEKCRQARLINSKGTIAQVKYLLQHHSPKEFEELVRHEMRILRRYHMKTQSKVEPKKNRGIK